MEPRTRDRPIYETIGVGYRRTRRSDPRIERHIRRHLGGARRVLNVGAGSGSYEPAEKSVVAVEPARGMISQRPAGAAPVVRAVAESLPFPDGCFDAATALLTVHHWGDSLAGLAETRRVTTGPIVVLTFDREVHERQWLVADYLLAMAGLD